MSIQNLCLGYKYLNLMKLKWSLLSKNSQKLKHTQNLYMQHLRHELDTKIKLKTLSIN